MTWWPSGTCTISVFVFDIQHLNHQLAAARRSLFNNMFTGSITSTILQMTTLTLLYVCTFNSRFCGIKAHLLPSKHRSLSGNQLTGQIPPTIGLLTSLSHLYVFACSVLLLELTPVPCTGVFRPTGSPGKFHRHLDCCQIFNICMCLLLVVFSRWLTLLASQSKASQRQPAARTDSDDGWTIDGAY